MCRWKNSNFNPSKQHVKAKKGLLKNWKKIEILVIDEVSMISCDFFDQLEEVARAARNKQAHFGGIQLILTGDFLQLPPVKDKGSENEAKFCFEANSWSDCVGKYIFGWPLQMSGFIGENIFCICKTDICIQEPNKSNK